MADERDTEIAGGKQQRFANLIEDDYATLLHEREEANKTRRARDMAVRTF